MYLSDGVNKVANTFKVVITYTGSTNTAPYFTDALVDQTVNAGGTGSYTLPPTFDS